jgi:alkylhydroperoxidase family enzyme
MSNIHDARKALLARIIDGDGESAQAQRHAAFVNSGLAEPLRTLIDKVTRRACSVTDDDVATALASGVSEDEIFELVVCAAIGQAARQYDAACAALQAAAQKDG